MKQSINKSAIMKKAWQLFRKTSRTFSECLKNSWKICRSKIKQELKSVIEVVHNASNSLDNSTMRFKNTFKEVDAAWSLGLLKIIANSLNINRMGLDINDLSGNPYNDKLKHFEDPFRIFNRRVETYNRYKSFLK